MLTKEFTKLAARKLFRQEGPVVSAQFLVGELFGDTPDKCGQPYVGHFHRVAAALPENLKPVGLLHDLVEDLRRPLAPVEKSWSFDDLGDIGHSDRDIQILEADTKLYRGEPRFDFAVRIGNAPDDIRPDLIRLRLADIADNSRNDRMHHLTSEKADDLKGSYVMMAGYLRDIFDGRARAGTPFADWMKTLPEKQQDWDLFDRHATPEGKIRESGIPPAMPAWRLRLVAG